MISVSSWWKGGGLLSGDNVHIHNDRGVISVTSWWKGGGLLSGDNVQIYSDCGVTSVRHGGLIWPRCPDIVW